MCEYCRFNFLDKENFDLGGDIDIDTVNMLQKIDFGDSVRIELDLCRYKQYVRPWKVDEIDEISDASLMLDVMTKPIGEEGYYNIDTRTIKIKYCPFCGEKL